MASRPVEFVGSRLNLARTYRRLTQTELGEKVSASAATIWQLEKGIKEPSFDLLQALADELGFEPAFFTDELLDRFEEEDCNFRHRRSAIQKLKKYALAHGSLVGLVIHHLQSILELPRYDIPKIPVRDDEDIERAAEQCREHWNLGLEAPIEHIGRVLERAGVVLVRHDEKTEKIDAFSRFGKVNVIVLNTSKQSASRTRFDTGHETGHLVMHSDCRGRMPQESAEGAANRFASAFLMSRRGFAREFRATSRVEWSHLFELKRRWKASVAAIVRRAWDLRLIDASRYRYLNQQIRVRGWHRSEPQEPEPEQPELLRIAFESLNKDLGMTLTDVAKALHWRPETLAEVVGLPVPEPESAGVVSLDSRRK